MAQKEYTRTEIKNLLNKIANDSISSVLLPVTGHALGSFTGDVDPYSLVVEIRNKIDKTFNDLNISGRRRFYGGTKEYLKESGNLGEYWKEGGFDNE